MSGLSLEEAIGREALVKLRDWLVEAYPVDEYLTTPANDGLTPNVRRQRREADARLSRLGYEPIGTLADRLRDRFTAKDEPRFYPEQYEDTRGRSWVRVMDRGTGKVAKLPIRQGREYVKQERFLTIDEAFHSVGKLNEAFNQ